MMKAMQELNHVLLFGGGRDTKSRIEDCRSLAMACMQNGSFSVSEYEKYSTLCDHEIEWLKNGGL